MKTRKYIKITAALSILLTVFSCAPLEIYAEDGEYPEEITEEKEEYLGEAETENAEQPEEITEKAEIDDKEELPEEIPEETEINNEEDQPEEQEDIVPVKTAEERAEAVAESKREFRKNFWSDDHSQYILDEETGTYASGIYEIDGDLYFFDPNNEYRMFTRGEKKTGGYWYYFGENGKAQKGFYTIPASGKSVYYDPSNGHMVYGFRKLKGKDGSDHWFYFNKNTGKMIQSAFQKVDEAGGTCYFDGNGYMVYREKKISGFWYYFDDNTGVMSVSVFRKPTGSDKTCYYDELGHMVHGQKKIGGYWYYFKETSGAMITGFKTIQAQNKTVYYDAQGRMVHGQKKVGGYWYYFKENSGAMITGWKKITSQKKTVYYDSKGRMVHGSKSIDGHVHYFDTKTGAWNLEKWLNTVSKPYYIKVNRAANTVTVYAKNYDSQYSIVYKAMICSTGTATPLGKYRTFGKSRWRALYGGVYGQYATDIVGDILFHSVPYAATRVNSLYYWKYNQLGTAASMGCVRLTVADAKWIYDNCSVGTMVEFYDNSKNPGPLGKPSAKKLSDNYKGYWDPTDPAPGNPWRN